jgi:hypothetical protein
MFYNYFALTDKSIKMSPPSIRNWIGGPDKNVNVVDVSF